MRAAPAVAVELRGSRRWDCACTALGALAAAAAAAALCAHLLPDAIMSGVSIAATAGCGGLLGWCLRPPGTGLLRWDGACWWFGDPARPASEERTGSVMVMMDWGGWMLLRFDPQAGTKRRARVWLPVSERRVLQAGALRAALYAATVTEFP